MIIATKIARLMATQYLSQTQQQKQVQVLAPQMRQSLELLQVPILELRAVVDRELRENPTLDEIPNDTNEQLEIEPGKGGEKEENEKEVNFKEEFERLSKLDEDWRDYFHQTRTPYRERSVEDEQHQFYMDSLSIELSLQEHLIKQLAYAGLDKESHRIGELIIGNIDNDGFLKDSIKDLSESTTYPIERVEEILHIIQDFDPIGVGARTIEECLLLQLRQINLEKSIVGSTVREHLKLVGAKKYKELEKKLNISMDHVLDVVRFIKGLNPRPGRRYTSETTTYIQSEMNIDKRNGSYNVMMNNDHLPHLRISKYYRKLMENPDVTPEVQNYIRDKIRSSTFLIKCIHQRQDTLKRIMEAIINVQKDFFDHGVSHLKPLTMAEIASTLNIHETTVSRAISNKFVHTPRGVYEMKYFFTPGFEKGDGQKISNKTIKDLLLHIIQDENTSRPLSDQKIVEILGEKGFDIARRTIAKYREELNILPIYLRRTR